MQNILVVKEKYGRIVYLTQERYAYILRHPEMQNRLEEVENTLKNPIIVEDSKTDQKVKYYYTYYKEREEAKYLRVIVKYLNGKGFIVTAYFVEKRQ